MPPAHFTFERSGRSPIPADIAHSRSRAGAGHRRSRRNCIWRTTRQPPRLFVFANERRRPGCVDPEVRANDRRDTARACARHPMGRARRSGDWLAFRRLIQRHHLVDIALQFAQSRLAAGMRRQESGLPAAAGHLAHLRHRLNDARGSYPARAISSTPMMSASDHSPGCLAGPLLAPMTLPADCGST